MAQILLEIAVLLTIALGVIWRRARRTAAQLAERERDVAERDLTADALRTTLGERERQLAKLASDRAGLQTLLQEYIEQREAAEETLQASEERYRVLAEAMNDIVTLQELDGTVIYCSPSAERILGVPPSELIGRDVFSIMHPDDRRRMAGDVRAATLRGRPPLFEWRCRRRDGSYVWVETQSTLLRDRRGAPERLVSVTRDIEQRKQAQEALRQSEERTRSLIARAAYGIFRATRDGRFVEVNPALVAMLHYGSAQELMQVDSLRDLFVDPGEHVDWLTHLETQQSPEWHDLRWRRKDGATIMVRLSIQAVRDPHGGLLFFEGIVEDVTERLRREELLRRSERMASLGRTLAGVAHELNNPLAAVSGYAQILLKMPVSDDERGALETIYREARRAARIVKDLLTFARPQESQGRELVDLNAIVRYIVDTQRYTIETRGIEVTLELNDAPVFLRADAGQLEQVVLNLVVNARQALEETLARSAARRDGWTPVIGVRTAVRPGEAMLEIFDNGAGIAAADLPRIWDPFFTTKEEGAGTGLGLSVVHRIVEAHEGAVEVESTVGRGTRFTLTFPRGAPVDDASALPALAPTATASTPPQAERPLDILVIDDEAVIRNLLSRYFTMRGHAVIAAEDGAQALRIAEQSSFDVVICDLRMPGLDGYEVIRRLEALPTCASARFILSTGDTANAARREEESAGVRIDAMVDKPYEVEALRRIVEGEVTHEPSAP